jgi:LacI family transcriptional regulator
VSRPTVNDIARAAGVSLATVDRVLNARPGVREKTILRVNEAIDRLGYVRDVAAANLARRRNYCAAYVLPDSPTAFMTTLAEAIASTSAHALFDRTTVRVVRVPAFDSTAYVRALDSLAGSGCDGIALMGPETPQVRDAIRRATEAGVAVVALVSDQPHSARHHFVGIDNVRAGRTAAMLLGRFAARPEGRVLVLAGSMMLRDHMERRLGFDAIMRERFPGMTVLPTVEARDDSQAVRRLLPLALAEHGPIDAIYSIGAGNRGLVEALDDLGLGAALTVVAHDLTPTMRRGLESGVIDAVITQDVGHMVRSALRVLRARSERLPIDPGQEQIRIEILIRENLPQDRAAATT